MHRPTLILLFGGLLAAAQVPLAYGDAAASDRLIREGLTLRQAGRDEDALPKFEQAYKESPTPRAAAQLGLCRQALGRFADAEELISQALVAVNDPWIAKNRDALSRALAIAKERVARVTVVGEPPGAEVLVGGKLLGRVPLEPAARVNAGHIDLQVRAPGYTTFHRSLELSGGAYQTIAVQLTRVEAPSPALGGPPTEPPQPASGPTLLARPADQPTSGDTREFYKRPWFWGVLGGVVVAGVVTAIAIAASGPSYPSTRQSETFP